jgi:hypothetical protein
MRSYLEFDFLIHSKLVNEENLQVLKHQLMRLYLDLNVKLH